MFEVEVRNVEGEPAAIGNAGPFTVVMDRPADGGGRGIGFNGGQLLYLAIAGCVSNDLFREARADGIDLQRVRVSVRGDFGGDPPVSTPVEYDVELSGDASEETLRDLARRVDEIAEIPNSLRRGTRVELRGVRV
jgi:putative redox protein